MPKHKKRGKKRKTQAPENPDEQKAPQSIVIRRGKVGRSMKILVQDFREVMLPNTALKLKERKSNNLNDFVSVAAQLSVSHLIAFSSTDLGAYVRFMKVPQGPTLVFKILEYSLSKDVHSTQQHPHTSGSHFKTAPLVVMNNFGSEREHQLMTATFQSMFPMINVQTIKLSDCRRVVLLNFDKETGRIEFRHYLIAVKPHGLSKSIKKLVLPKTTKDLPSLGQFEDIADYVLGNAQQTESDIEDGPENTLELPDKYVGKGNRKAQRSAVRLIELGPRMSMQLVKIQEGFGEGEVLFHSFIQKSNEEVERLRQQKARETHEKELRKKQQDENYARKHPDKVKAEDNEENEEGEEGENSASEQPVKEEDDDQFDFDIEEPSDSEDEQDEFEIKQEIDEHQKRFEKAQEEDENGGENADDDEVIEVKEEQFSDEDNVVELKNGSSHKQKRKEASNEETPIEIKEEEDDDDADVASESSSAVKRDEIDFGYQLEQGHRAGPRDLAKVFKRETKRARKIEQHSRKRAPLIGSAKKKQR